MKKTTTTTENLLNNFIIDFGQNDSVLTDEKKFNEFKKFMIKFNFNREFYIDELLVITKMRKELLNTLELCYVNVTKLIDCELNESVKSQLTDFRDSVIKASKTNITNQTNQFDESLQLFEKATDVELQSYLKTKGFYNWETPIVKYDNSLYEIKGFTNNARTFLHVKNDMNIQYIVGTYNYNSKAQKEHFESLCKLEKDIVIKAIKSFLGNAKGNDLDKIIRVQKAIKEAKYKKSQAQKAVSIKENLGL